MDDFDGTAGPSTQDEDLSLPKGLLTLRKQQWPS
jgi:hypothetical protein